MQQCRMSGKLGIWLVLAVLTLSAGLGVVTAYACSCVAPDKTCSANGSNACCGCGTSGSECVTCQACQNCTAIAGNNNNGNVGTADCS